MCAPPGSSTPLETKAARSGRLSQCLDSAVVKISASVKDNFWIPFSRHFLAISSPTFLAASTFPGYLTFPRSSGLIVDATDEGFLLSCPQPPGHRYAQTSKNIQAWPFHGSRDTAPYPFFPFALARSSCSSMGLSSLPVPDGVPMLWSFRPSCEYALRDNGFPSPCRAQEAYRTKFCGDRSHLLFVSPLTVIRVWFFTSTRIPSGIG